MTANSESFGAPRPMKYPVRRFKSLAVALKELEPFIRNGAHLHTGKPFERFGGMRSREILANWLLCVTANAADNQQFTFSTDPTGGDGIICDTESEDTWPTERVMVPPLPRDDARNAEEKILAAIEQKRAKGGAAYAAGKTLIVFLEGNGEAWFPNRIARRLPQPLLFEAVWVVSLRSAECGRYVYNVTCLDCASGDAPAFLVSIAEDFNSWTVDRVQ
jgi:hypothetical protein